MNLLFWKKKTGAGEEEENALEDSATNSTSLESPDFDMTEQYIAEQDPELTSQKIAARPGLVARLLGTLTRPFNKPPAFHAEGDHIPEAPGGSEKLDDVTAIEPDLESSDKPGLAVRMKSRLIAMTSIFRKTPAPDAEKDEDHADKADESPAPETPAKPGLFMRIKAGFAAFVREFKTPAAPAASEDDEHEEGSRSRYEAVPDGEDANGVSDSQPVRSKKWLRTGGAIFLLVLLLSGIGVVIWLIFTPPQIRSGTRHGITTTSRIIRPESAPKKSQISAPEKPQTEVEVIKKENAELPARIEAPKKEPPQQQPYVPTVRPNEGNAPSSSVSGEMMISGKDPKAAAMSLKEAIKAMNASSGDRGKKPAK